MLLGIVPLRLLLPRPLRATLSERAERAANSQVGQCREGSDAVRDRAVQLIAVQVPARVVRHSARVVRASGARGGARPRRRAATHRNVTRLPSALHLYTPVHVHTSAAVFQFVLFHHPAPPAAL